MVEKPGVGNADIEVSGQAIAATSDGGEGHATQLAALAMEGSHFVGRE